MNKTLLTLAAAAVVLTAGAAQAETKASAKADVKADTGIVAAVSNTAGAAKEKTSEGINTVKGSFHQNMADSNAQAAKDNLATGEFAAAATDAKDAAEHQAVAIDAKTKAAISKSKASKDWANAKAAISTSGTVTK